MSTRAISGRVVLVWTVFAGLLAAMLAIESGGWLAPTPPAPTGRLPMFGFTESDLGAVEIEYRGRRVALMRNHDGDWFKHGAAHRHGTGDAKLDHGGTNRAEPEDHHGSPEEARQIAETLEVSARMRSDRMVEPDRALDAYGLEQPQAMIAFYGREGDAPDWRRPLQVLYVGDLLTTGYAYYTLRDGDQGLSLLPRYQVALLLQLAFGEAEAPSLMPEGATTGG